MPDQAAGAARRGSAVNPVNTQRQRCNHFMAPVAGLCWGLSDSAPFADNSLRSLGSHVELLVVEASMNSPRTFVQCAQCAVCVWRHAL